MSGAGRAPRPPFGKPPICAPRALSRAQDAQRQLLAAVKGAVSEGSFEASVYHQMAQATVCLEQARPGWAAPCAGRGRRARVAMGRARLALGAG